MDRCLVTGATGFIGGHLTRRLRRDGYGVRCLVRAGSDAARVQDLRALGAEIVVGDLSDAESLLRAAQNADAVVHCAAMVSDWGTVPEITAANVEGTRGLLAAAVAAGVRRFVQISSTDVYGYPGRVGADAASGVAPTDRTGGGPISGAADESFQSRRFRNWYAQTKLMAERELQRVAHDHGLESVILRPATVYGPGSREVILEIGRALRAHNMLLIGGGRADAGLVYVGNLVDAIVLALRASALAPGPRSDGETGELLIHFPVGHGADGSPAAVPAFNITDGVEVTWRRLGDDLADGLGAPHARLSIPYPLVIALATALEQGYRVTRRLTGLHARALLSRQAVQVMGIDQSFSNRSARDLLGWEPRVSYPEGMQTTLDWLRGSVST